MVQLIPLLAGRRSPRAFDPAAVLTDDELSALLEAARWAPSSGNSQPWRFVVGRRGDARHKEIFNRLTSRNQRWAGRASALLVAAYRQADDAGAPLSHGPYDLGQAVAHLSVQAQALGLYVHQMAGFDPDGLHADLNLPTDVRPHVVVAIGRLGDPTTLPEDLFVRETAERTRLAQTDLLLGGTRSGQRLPDRPRPAPRPAWCRPVVLPITWTAFPHPIPVT
jgi:nitroreductase